MYMYIDRLVVRFVRFCQISDIMRLNESSCIPDDEENLLWYYKVPCRATKIFSYASNSP